MESTRRRRTRARSGRPGDQAAADAIVRLEPVRVRGRVDDRLGNRPPARGPGASPDFPRTSRSLRSATRAGTDSGKANGARPNTRRTPSIQPARAIEVQDVRVFVGEGDAQPVVGIADQRLGGRRRRGDLDRVVRKRVRPAVRQIGLIDEDHVHPPARQSQRRLERRANVLDDRREAPRQRFFSSMRVDVEVRRANRPESQAPVVARRGATVGHADGRDRRGDQDTDRQLNAVSSASSLSSASSARACSGVSWLTSSARSRRRSASSAAIGRLEQAELLLARGCRCRSATGGRRATARRARARSRISRARDDDDGRQAGEPRDLDAVAAIGATRHDLAQEHDVVLPLAHDDVEVGDARQRVGEIGQLVVVRGEDRLRPRRGFDARCSATAHARLRPSNVAVPRPISSRMTRLRDVAACRMFAVSCISTMNVDWPRAMLSDAPTRAKRRSTIGSFALRAGTNEPACAIRQSSAHCRR